MHFTGLQLELRLVQRAHAGKRLAQLADRNQGGQGGAFA
jgi:hypothetical protein